MEGDLWGGNWLCHRRYTTTEDEGAACGAYSRRSAGGMDRSKYSSCRSSCERKSELERRASRERNTGRWGVQLVRPGGPSIAETPTAQSAGRRMDFPVDGSRVNGLERLARNVTLTVGVNAK